MWYVDYSTAAEMYVTICRKVPRSFLGFKWTATEVWKAVAPGEHAELLVDVLNHKFCKCKERNVR